MALTYTPAGQLGSPCPDFSLISVDGARYSRQDFAAAPALVVMFICNHCPYVKAIEDRLLQLSADYKKQNVAFVAICSNDGTDNEEDRPEQLLQRWKDKNYGFPYLLDSSQTAAKAFGAVCTPDLYVFDAGAKLRYRGRLDDSWRDPNRVRKQELRAALTAILQGHRILEPQNPSMGCSIKWK